ncbi:hypothetical protein ACWEKT_38060 [Nocardia takedensis]
MSDESAVTVDYDRLTEVFAMLIAHLRAKGRSQALERDAFWSIPVARMHEVYAEPELTIGLVSETWENLRNMIADDDASPQGLIWVADILRALGSAAMR